jgi:hypothetical protein
MDLADRKSEFRSRALWFGSIIALVIIAGLLISNGVSGFLGVSREACALVGAIAFVGAFVGASILCCREALHYAVRQMVFVLTDDSLIRRRSGYPELRIAFSDVRSLSEELGYLIVRSADQQTKIGIPRNVKGYEAIRAELEKHHSLLSHARLPWNGIVILLLSIVSWAVILWSRQIGAMVPAAVIAVLTLMSASRRLWLLLYVKRRFLLWSCLAVVWCTAALLIFRSFTSALTL